MADKTKTRNKTLTIRDMPRIEKPREKLEKYGPDKLSNEELLAIILRTGKAGKNVIQLAKEVLTKIETPAEAKLEELKKIKGIGTAKACEIVSVFELGKRLLQNKKQRIIKDPQDIWNAMHDIVQQKKEHFVVFFLDPRSQEVKREIISIGTLDMSLVHPREVFEPAVRYLASHIIISHNHPSGDLQPSIADLEVTKKLSAAGKIMGIEVLDHVIVSKNGWYSMHAHGEMGF